MLAQLHTSTNTGERASSPVTYTGLCMPRGYHPPRILMEAAECIQQSSSSHASMPSHRRGGGVGLGTEIKNRVCARAHARAHTHTRASTRRGLCGSCCCITRRALWRMRRSASSAWRRRFLSCRSRLPFSHPPAGSGLRRPPRCSMRSLPVWEQPRKGAAARRGN